MLLFPRRAVNSCHSPCIANLETHPGYNLPACPSYGHPTQPSVIVRTSHAAILAEYGRAEYGRAEHGRRPAAAEAAGRTEQCPCFPASPWRSRTASRCSRTRTRGLPSRSRCRYLACSRSPSEPLPFFRVTALGLFSVRLPRPRTAPPSNCAGDCVQELYRLSHHLYRLSHQLYGS